MYGALWRALPGPAWLRVLLLLALAAAVVLACFEWLFPVVAEHMPFNDPNVRQAAHVVPSSPPSLQEVLR
ncbi:hypothetical protein [Cellulosimicrobium arenosum]|uniref:Uncharacterized protein n=1 Tax=Cellulosimicrobium arenosum TaxID=2708133 RepID=A0A927PG10_9MICO|nr:hypothetical protein [Cellulosimicrobium arenosum]MBD8080000.1 hypothetical protein [Cellulosimicrobium arenosum]